MNTRINRGRRWLVLALALAFGPTALTNALAQSSQASTPVDSPSTKALPRPDQLEPGVDTTATAPANATGAVPGPAPAPSPRAAPAGSSAADSTAARPAAAASADGGKKGSTPSQKTATAGRKGAERLELDTTDITGNRELPKVLYIVPWKRSDLGDLVGKPVNSLVDEVLQPLDRDVFQRENRYYNAVKPGQQPAQAGAAPGTSEQP